MDHLKEILQRVEVDLKEMKERIPLKKLEKQVAEAPKTRDFIAAIGTAGPIRIIAEIKRRSPSAGALRPGLDPGSLARNYEKAGATALSVLTNGPYFDGEIGDLTEARNSVRLPVLRKDFIIDPYQVVESRAAGADAILLMMAAATDDQINSLEKLAGQLHMSALVEVHCTLELERALNLGARLIGINNRNLRDLSVDLSVTLELERHIPPHVCLVAESGYQRPDQIRALAGSRVRAVLVGESLLRHEDPSGTLQALVKAGSPQWSK